MSKRIEWLDASKGILIALVVLGHIMPLGHLNSEDVGESISSAFRMYIYACHIPAFFIISGILKSRLNYFSKTNTLKTVLFKQKKTFLYYIIFSIIFFGRYTVQFLAGQISSTDLLMFVYNTLMLVGMGVLWFLPAFIFSEILFFILMTRGTPVKLIYILSVIVMLVFTSFKELHGIGDSFSPIVKLEGLFYRTMIGCSFVIIGYFMDKYKMFEPPILFVGVLSVGAFYNGNVDLNNLFFHNVFLYYFFAISGTMLVFVISKYVISLNKKFQDILIKWGGATLLIMCTHAILLVIQTSEMVSGRFFNNQAIIIISTFILSMIVETIMVVVYSNLRIKYNNRIIHL